MAKVTSKLQVTVPKRLADAYGIRPGDDIGWAAAGNHLRIDPARQRVPARTPEERLKRFDQASDRQRRRHNRATLPRNEAPAADGRGRISMPVAALVDTNVLVYRFDPRDPRKQRLATDLPRESISTQSIQVPHQAILEFVAAVTRPLAGGRALLALADAGREAEDLLAQFDTRTRPS